MRQNEESRAVEDARPPSAWILVSVAGATLWITQQLAIWAIALQVLAILYSLLWRDRPQAWRSSGIVLNFGMFGIVGATIVLALRGYPATLSLAHFAALTQGLQLLDTRPRKSEFLLVALALFQVILSANLTDSVFFPPLLAVFLVAATWTLLVHTLRSEALRADEVRAVSRAVNTGLLRMTLLASGACLVLTLILFVTLPRLRSSMIRGGIGGSLAVSGFSDQVELGTIGRIRKDPTVVLRVETIWGDAPERTFAYWRGLAFDTFDGRRWSITPLASQGLRRPLPGSPRFGVELNGGRETYSLVQRVVREPVEAGVVFGIGVPRRVEGPLYRLERDVNGGLYATAQMDERIRYTIWTQSRTWEDAELRSDRATSPRMSTPLAPKSSQRYLALPDLDTAIGELARRITEGSVTDADRSRAIERYLRSEGRYTDTPPDIDRDPDRSPIEGFLLGGLAGHCEYFASAMIVLSRSIGLPSRLVNGFAGGRRNRIGGFVELARSDAHAWVEIHFERAGWVRYDPTPPDLRLRADTVLNMVERLAELGSVIELWWFQRVVDFDSSDQIQALKASWGVWRSLRSAYPAGKARRGRSFALDWRPGAELPWRELALLALAAGLLLCWRQGRLRRVRKETLPRAYRRALRMLERRGLQRSPSTTARAFANQVRTALPEGAGNAFASLTESYLGERFGAQPCPASDIHLVDRRRFLGRLGRRSAHTVDAMGLGNQAHVG